MGVYIKDMEMPKVCAFCPFMIDGGIDMSFCAPLRKIEKNQMTLSPDCPLVPVPPHGRCVDADKLTQEMRLFIKENMLLRDDARELLETIESAPTVLEAEKGDT